MVEDRWKEHEAAAHTTLIAQRVYSSRLLGADPSLVLHGGGNTSLKDVADNLFGETEAVIRVKGSGWDLAKIEEAGLPAMRLHPLSRLRQLEALGDAPMMNQLRSQLLDARAPDPSVETLLHAFLPHRFIDHTHADAVLTLTNQPLGEGLVRELYGRRVGIVPYIMPGFQLAKACATIYEADPSVVGLVLLKHGVFTFGETARESYQRMIELVRMAEDAIRSRRRISPPAAAIPTTAMPGADLQAWWMHALRCEFTRRQWPCCAVLDRSAQALAFVGRADARVVASRGPMTPDHVIRTKAVPLLLAPELVSCRDQAGLAKAVDAYAAAYHGYVSRCRPQAAGITVLDPWPRLVLLPGVGAVALGATAREAGIAREIYQHTMHVIEDAEACSCYEALPEQDLFCMEYWVLEQAKLSLGPKRLPLSGKTAVISGGASGIGLAIAQELIAQGANVAIFDRNREALDHRQAELEDRCRSGNGCLFACVDVTRRAEVQEAVLRTIITFGGIDIVVVNAGVFPPSADIESITDPDWSRAMEVNLSGSFHVIAEHLPWLKRQPSGGDILLIASKNVPAPGKQAAAYSVSKAGQTQLARVCALEAGPYGIRVNTLHPHLVLDTEIWTPEVIAARAKAYGMTVEQYRTNNLLKTEISSRDVARSAAALVMGAFSKTTGAQICVDGGSDRTI